MGCFNINEFTRRIASICRVSRGVVFAFLMWHVTTLQVHADDPAAQADADDDTYQPTLEQVARKGLWYADKVSETLFSVTRVCSKSDVGTARFTAADGARQVMAAAFGTCSVLKGEPLDLSKETSLEGKEVRGLNTTEYGYRVMTNRREFLRSHAYYKRLIDADFNPSTCDTRAQPFAYFYGGRPNRDRGEINFDANRPRKSLRGQALPYAGIDCSAFVSMGLMMSGLSPVPIKNPSSTRDLNPNSLIASSVYLLAAKSGKGCFNSVKLDQAPTLKPGDVLSWDGHVVMIESAGIDPFGLSGITSPSDCKTQISPSKFNFNIIQSGGDLGGIGMSRVKGDSYFSNINHTEIAASLMKIVERACFLKFGDTQPTKGRSKPRPLKVDAASSKLAFIRHVGSAKPECVIPENRRFKLNREECIEGCFR
jgi:hypothetical protein